MSGRLSVVEILASLEAQIAEHRDKAASHGEQEAFHREQKELHTAELERLSQQYEAFKAAASTVEHIARMPQAKAADDRDLGSKPRLGKVLARVVDSWQAGIPFGPSAVAAEANRRFAGNLRHRIDGRAVSTFLRRRRDLGLLEEVREGRPFQEALYRKRPQP